MDPRGKNKFRWFYSYFDRLDKNGHNKYGLDENVKLKLEHHLINPFLIDKDQEEHRNKMFEFYMIFNGDHINYNQFLPQSHFQITVHVCFYYLNSCGKNEY